MKKIGFLIIVSLIFSCERMDEPQREVEVSIKISGFNITADDFGTLKDMNADIFDNFSHKFAGGELHFLAPSGAEYSFYTVGNSISGFVFSIMPGTYQLTGSGGIRSYAGKADMSFSIPSQEIIIEESTTTINITVTPDCGLMIVADENTLLQSAVIRSSEPPPQWDLFIDGIYYYSYFEPRDNYFFRISKTNGTVMEVETSSLQVGYIYKVEVTDGGGATGVLLNPTFQEGERIIW